MSQKEIESVIVKRAPNFSIYVGSYKYLVIVTVESNHYVGTV